MPMSERKPPGQLLFGDLEDHVRTWPNLSLKVSPQMKAHLMNALHQEGWTLSVSEYLRVIVARHVAEVLNLSAAEVLHGQPHRGATKGYRFMRVK